MNVATAANWGAFINGKRIQLYFGASFNLAGGRERDEGWLIQHVTHNELNMK